MFRNTNTDRLRIYIAAFLRATGTSLLGVMLGVYLPSLNYTSSEIGLIVGTGLTGGAIASLIITLTGDRISRRSRLIWLSALTSSIGFCLIFTSSLTLVLLISFFGMLNGMGRDRSASLILEQAILPSTVNAERRTQAFAWYNVFLDAGHSIGGLMVSLPLLFPSSWGVQNLDKFKILIIIYSLLNFVTLILYLGFSPSIEIAKNKITSPDKPQITKQTKRVVWKISTLFLIDSLGGGFLTTALLSYFFFKRFNVNISEIGFLFFVARILNMLSHFAAAWLAKRIGLINTMVFTHIPSSLLLITVAFAPNFTIAAILFLLREGLTEMDVPTRQSYVMAVVKPEERVFASSVTNLVRTAGWAIAPSFAGLIMGGIGLLVPLIVGANLKILYDILLYLNFKKLKPPEEKKYN